MCSCEETDLQRLEKRVDLLEEQVLLLRALAHNAIQTSGEESAARLREYRALLAQPQAQKRPRKKRAAR